MHYAYSVWTWVTGDWSLILGSNNRAAAQQLQHALTQNGYNSDYQRAYFSGAVDFTPHSQLRLSYGGRVYTYGDCPDLSAANDATLALGSLFPSGHAVVARGKQFLDARQIARLIERPGYA